MYKRQDEYLNLIDGKYKIFDFIFLYIWFSFGKKKAFNIS